VKVQSSAAALAAVLAALALTSCQAKETASTSSGEGSGTDAPPAEITVDASDDACELSGAEGKTGANTFVITNSGSKVTEFYVYDEGERVMGEVENVSPGLERKLIVQLTEPGTYQTACKPGMICDGIRGDYTVTGDTVQIDTEGKFKEAANSYKRYVNSQVEALVPAVEGFATVVKTGDVNAAKLCDLVRRPPLPRVDLLRMLLIRVRYVRRSSDHV